MAQPNFDQDAAEALTGMANVSYIKISGEYSLSGYLLDDPDADKLLIYFYGISDDAASSMLKFCKAKNTEEAYPDVDIAVIDWPGYGRSEGHATDSSLRQAAVDIVNEFFAGNVYHYDDITIMGYSLGTGPATYAAGICGCDDLILLAPYYSAADLYNSVTPVFYGPMKQLLGFTMDTYKYAASVRIAPLIIASSSDTRVSADSCEKLSAYFPAGCTFTLLDGISHGDLPESPQVMGIISERVNTHSAAR